MRKIQAIALMALATLFFESCSMDEEPIGANVTPAKEGFEVLKQVEVNDETVNFGIDSVTLSASFSQAVTFTATFKGLSSGAIKTIKTTAQELTSDVLTWYGEHEGLTFFREGEKVEVSLSFVGSSVTTKDTLTITSTNKFSTTQTYNFKEAGFENLDFSNAYGNGWFVGNGEDTPNLTRIPVTSPVPPQGLKAFKLAGKNVAGGVFITGMDFSITGKNKYIPLPASADSVWFNVYVYGNSTSATELYIEFKEADALPRWTNGQTDGVQAIIRTNHEGWKLFSFQYSTLSFSTYTPGGGNGNKIHESDKIQAVTYNLQTAETAKGEYVEAIIDYPIFTIGGPFDPSILKSKP